MKKINILLFCLISSTMLHAQGLHFSQFYNAPMLLNPANTGLLQNSDWRVGTSYRNQWATVPVNYNTFSVFADLGAFRNNWETSWLGAGVAVWRDAAGVPVLALTPAAVSLASNRPLCACACVRARARVRVRVCARLCACMCAHECVCRAQYPSNIVQLHVRGPE